MDKPVKTRRKEERPGEILEAAFEEFVQKGYAATRLEDVATRIGVTKATIYFYFENKEVVFVTMVRELLRPLVARAEEFLAGCRYDVDHSSDFIRAYMQFFYTSIVADRRAGEMLRLLIAEAGRFPELVDEHFQNFVRPMLKALRQALVAGATEGSLRQSPVSDFPEILLAPALQLNIWMLAYSGRRPVDMDGHLEASIDLFLHGLLPRPDSSSTSSRSKPIAKSAAKTPPQPRTAPSRRRRAFVDPGKA